MATETKQTTERSEAQQRSEEQLAQEHGVEPGTVKLIDAVVKQRLEGLTGALRDLAAEIAGEPEEQPAPLSTREEARKFLEGYAAEHMTTDERMTAYVLLDLAQRNPALADAIKDILWEHAGFCFEDVRWHERAERLDSPEAIRDIQTVLNFWRQQTQPAEPEKEAQPQAEALDEAQQLVAEAMAKQPTTPKKKYSSNRTIEDAVPAEKVVVDWLLKQNYATKLACVIMHIWLFGDHNTDGITNDIISRFSDEILANVKNPPDSLSREEMAMSGVVAEAQVWLEHC